MSYIRKKGHIDTSIQKPFSGKYGLLDLTRMMTYPRPADSKPESRFIKEYIDIVPGMKRDKFGNRFIQIGKKPTTVFASHTDTVHEWSEPSREERIRRFSAIDPVTREFRTKAQARAIRRKIKRGVIKLPEEEPTPGRQKVFVKGKWAYKHDDDVLGADDTTGNWIMLNLIHEKKPGLYVFHRKEEIGGLGSEFFVKNKKPLLKGKKRVISFDRKGYEDVITHQLRGRTASDKFAKDLSGKLGGGYKPSPFGTFTDSANYAKIVPECTNISVGFKHAHTRDERQNLRFARHLYKRVRDINFEELPTKRDPSKTEYRPYNMYTWGYAGYGFKDDLDDDFDKERNVYRPIRDIVKEGKYQEKKNELQNETKSQWIKRIGPYSGYSSLDKPFECKECGVPMVKTFEGGYYCGNTKCSRYHKSSGEHKKQSIRNVPFDESTFYDDFVYADMKKKKKEGIIE